MPHFFLLLVLVSGVTINANAFNSTNTWSVTKREDSPYIIDGSHRDPGPYPHAYPPDKEQEERSRTPRPGNLFIAQDHDIRVIETIHDNPKTPEENRSRRPSSMMSLLKSFSIGGKEEESEAESPPSTSPAKALVESSYPAVEHDYGHGHHQGHHHGHLQHHRGWQGNHKPYMIHHKHTHDIKEGWGKGHHDKFSLLDFVLLGLSLLSLGGFLLNLLMNLLSLAGFFTSQTVPTVVTVPATNTGGGTATGGTSTSTGGGTSTSTGGGTITGGGTSTGGGTITVTGTATGGGAGGGITVGAGGGGITVGAGVSPTGILGGANIPLSGSGSSGLFTSLGAAISKKFKNKKRRKRTKKVQSANRISANLGFGGTKGGLKGRKKRSLFDPHVDVATSLDVAARSILNSIESMTHHYECMERVACESNKHAMVISKGLQVFMPIYSFSASYFGAKMGLHSSLPNHTRAIFLGISELNCNTAFPQCDIGIGNHTLHPQTL